jgi:hypothetical protein
MIITRRNGTLFLVEQHEHARLAGDLCDRWGNERFDAPCPAAPMRLASDLHDEGWRELDGEPRFNGQAARPLHFLEIAQDEHVALYGHGVEAAGRQDPYAGLLVSMHWTGLYRARWGLQSASVFIAEDSPVAQLQDDAIAAEERRWIELKRALVQGRRRSDFEIGLWHNYELLQTYDVMSLYVCTAPLQPSISGDEPVPVVSTLKSIDQQPGPRTIEAVPCRPAGERVNILLTATEPGGVIVDPYPFDEDGVRVELSGRVIPDRRYRSAAEAAAATAASAAQKIECEFRRA